MRLSFLAAASVFIIAIILHNAIVPEMAYTMTDFIFVSFFSLIAFLVGIPRKAH